MGSNAEAMSVSIKADAQGLRSNLVKVLSMFAWESDNRFSVGSLWAVNEATAFAALMRTAGLGSPMSSFSKKAPSNSINFLLQMYKSSSIRALSRASRAYAGK